MHSVNPANRCARHLKARQAKSHLALGFGCDACRHSESPLADELVGVLLADLHQITGPPHAIFFCFISSAASAPMITSLVDPSGTISYTTSHAGGETTQRTHTTQPKSLNTQTHTDYLWIKDRSTPACRVIVRQIHVDRPLFPFPSRPIQSITSC